jgi:hypothetical protein
MVYALWAIAGWCGTPWPWWWKWKWLPPPPPPDPRWWVVKVVAVASGLIGGWVVNSMFAAPDSNPSAVAATSLGAFFFGRFFSEIVGYFNVGQQPPSSEP